MSDTFFRQRLGPLADKIGALRPNKSVWVLIALEVKAQRVFLITNSIGFVLFTAAGLWWAWLLMWLLPMATWLLLVSRLRNIAEHALIVENSTDPLRHARTTHTHFFERALIAPYWVNHHCEHHMFSHIPCWHLAKAHRLLAIKGVRSAWKCSPVTGR